MFRKPEKTKYGNNAEFHKPIMITIHPRTDKIEIVMGLFNSKQDYEDGAEHISTRRYVYESSSNPVRYNSIINQLRGNLVDEEPYQGAQDED